MSGGAAFLNDFQVCGLVESLLAAGKKLSGKYGGNEGVDKFLGKSSEVLNEEKWNNWGEENRQSVQEAVKNLKITVEELRDGLFWAANMKNDMHANGNKENSSEILEIFQGEEIAH